MSHDALNIEGVKQEPALLKKHAKFFVRFLNLLPARLASHDSTRGTIAFFAVCGLDVLNSLPLLTKEMQKDVIEWIYGGLVTSNPEKQQNCSGFQGSRCVNIISDDEQLQANARNYQWGHLAMTYTGIGILATLGDDLSRIDRKSIVDGVAAVQRPDGSFSACVDGSENDMRFVFCAAAICHMLDYWGDVDKEKMFEFITSCIRYDNGFSQYLEGEAHGGTTFCALAALELSGQLHRLDVTTIENIKRWLIFRQVNGFQGRPNKAVDTCYSFWIGAALRILGAFELIDYEENRAYIMETQDSIVGGFSKWPQSTTDPFHTYFGLCGLSFMNEPGLSAVMPSLNISMRAYNRLQQLHAQWQVESTDDRFVSNNKSASSKLNRDENSTSVTSPLIEAQ
ncbi:geranylgeranyl transferase type-1 subunit beta [Bactrocera neohumeralis]|uniref:geranylgeranyl transferase type-1 subunit beta n=1 Tax=Bactrocera neohumeralis TaxID=98809 RepID=UPI002164F9C8|nr:geranylgeranyl transferase type-1 subunit beta [Bactrocera neohumeralis]